MASDHAKLLHGLELVHAALRRGLDTIVRVAEKPIPAADRADFADFAGRFARFLHSHHDGEEEIIFPALLAKMPGDAARIAAWRDDHQKLLGKLADFEAAVRGGAHDKIAAAGTALRDVLFPHLDAEEQAWDEATLAKSVSGAEAIGLARAASKHGQKHGGPRQLMYFLHGLTDEEQRSHFAAMPWFVRRILIKRIWERGYRPLLKYAHNRSIAL